MKISAVILARYALYLFMFSINLEMINLLGGGSALSFGRVAGYIYIASILLARFKLTIRREKNLFYLLVLFLIIIVFSSGLHLNIISVEVMDFTLLQNVVLFFILLIHERNDPGILDKSIVPLVAGSVLLSLFYFLKIGVEVGLGGRLSLFGDNENMIGIRMVIGIMILLNYINNSKNKFTITNVIMLVSVFAMLMVMRETSSRVSVLSFVIDLLLLMLFYLSVNKEINKFFYVTVFAVVVATIAIPFVFSNDILVHRLMQAREGDLAGRDRIWLALLPAVLDSPYIGYGISGYNMVAWKNLGGLGSPHNVILEVLLYSGVIGIIVFLIFHIYVIWGGIMRYRYEKEYIGLLLLVPYLGMIMSAQTLGKKLIWFLLAYNSIGLFADYGKKKKKTRSGYSAV